MFPDRTSHITQIAAVGPKGKFNRYVLPAEPITPGAASITGNNSCYCTIFLEGDTWQFYIRTLFHSALKDRALL